MLLESLPIFILLLLLLQFKDLDKGGLYKYLLSESFLLVPTVA
jgi:hypothetical protein